jgi:hypothetical protein
MQSLFDVATDLVKAHKGEDPETQAINFDIIFP